MQLKIDQTKKSRRLPIKYFSVLFNFYQADWKVHQSFFGRGNSAGKDFLAGGGEGHYASVLSLNAAETLLILPPF